MVPDFIFAHDFIFNPETGKNAAIIRNGEVFRDDKEGARIAIFVGTRVYDLDGILLGRIAAGDRSLPIAFKKLLEGSGKPVRASDGVRSGDGHPYAALTAAESRSTG
jgi:hypothetical protein